MIIIIIIIPTVTTYHYHYYPASTLTISCLLFHFSFRFDSMIIRSPVLQAGVYFLFMMYGIITHSVLIRCLSLSDTRGVQIEFHSKG